MENELNVASDEEQEGTVRRCRERLSLSFRLFITFSFQRKSIMHIDSGHLHLYGIVITRPSNLMERKRGQPGPCG